VGLATALGGEDVLFLAVWGAGERTAAMRIVVKVGEMGVFVGKICSFYAKSGLKY